MEIDNPVEKYYAVSLPPSIDSSSLFPFEEPLIFKSQEGLRQFLKKEPQLRFRCFSNYEDALRYCLLPLMEPLETINGPYVESCTEIAEERSTFKPLKSSEMAELRRIIQEGNENLFKEMVFKNPWSLINPHGDDPSILQESSRYNALHIAAKYNRPKMCLFILDAIQNLEFLAYLYSKDGIETLKKRRKHLVDFYLNTPDRILGETPLHFASRFAAFDVMKILTTYPECNKFKQNKCGLTPFQIIGQRLGHDFVIPINVKEQIYWMFDGTFFVPILRDVNGSQQPTLGKPCCSDVVLKVTSLSSNYTEESGATYSAFIGPLRENEAFEIFMMLKKISSLKENKMTKDYPEEQKEILNIINSDSVKGLERVARKLSRLFNSNVYEFWPKLQFWGSFSTSAGLQFLDHHLKVQLQRVNMFQQPLNVNESYHVFITQINTFMDNFLELLPYILHNRNTIPFFIIFNGLATFLYDIYKSGTFFDEDISLKFHDEIGHLLYLKLKEEDCYQDFIRYIHKEVTYLSTFLSSFPCNGREKWSVFLCILKFVIVHDSEYVFFQNIHLCSCNWNKDINSCIFSSHACYSADVKVREKFLNKQTVAEVSAGTKSLFQDKDNFLSNQIVDDITAKTKSLAEKYTPPSKVIQGVAGNHISPSEVTQRLSEAVEREIILPFHKYNLDYRIKNIEGVVVERDNQFRIFNCLEDSNGKLFLLSIDKFCMTFRDIILNNVSNIPISTKEVIYCFKDYLMPYFKHACHLNFLLMNTTFYHWKIAQVLFLRLYIIDSTYLQKWSSFLENVEFYEFDLHLCSNSQEWLHLFCVINLFCNLLNQDTEPKSCTCNFDCSHLQFFEKPNYCFTALKELEVMYRYASNQYKNLSLTQRKIAAIPNEHKIDQLLALPLLDSNVFLLGKEFSEFDIDVFRAIVDKGITTSHFHHLLKWKTAVECELESLIKTGNDLCSPASSSARIIQAIVSNKKLNAISVEDKRN